MEEELSQKENYRRTSGVQEKQWSKGKDPVLTPANFIETNLIEIEDLQFIDGIAQRYGVSREDLFPSYLMRRDADGTVIKQSRVLLSQIENILTQEKRYRFVIKGDSEEEYIYPLDGFELTEEAVVQATQGTQKEMEVAGDVYQVRSSMIDRYTNKKYTILEGAREELQIAEQEGNLEPELLMTRPYLTKYDEVAHRDQKGEEYYSADFEFLDQEERTGPEEEKETFVEKLKKIFQKLFGKSKPKELPAPQKRNRLETYKLDSDQYSVSPEEMSKLAKQRLLEDLKKNGRGTEKKEEGMSK